jgi:hypothetical protein
MAGTIGPFRLDFAQGQKRGHTRPRRLGAGKGARVAEKWEVNIGLVSGGHGML